MDDTKREALAGLLVGLVPANGSATWNRSRRQKIMETVQGRSWS